MIATSLTAPKFVVWMELPDQHIVGHAVVMPEDTEGAVARTLRRALTQPVAGSPRRPDVIRVADATIAAEVRDEVAGTIPVKVAPTPELDELLKHMQAAMPEVEGGEASYFAGSHVSPAAVEKLFTAAFSLFAIKPWTVANDTQVLRMDIPALDVDGACLSIIGQLDESRGVLIFKSNTFAPVCESYFDDDDREVRFTGPYEAFTDFDLAESIEPEFDTLLQQRAAEPFRPQVGRNAPCPCGSGRKYKKYHLADDEAEHARLQATAQTHAIDERLSRFAVQAFGPAWEAFEDDFADPDEAMQLALPWSVYCFEVEGTTVVDTLPRRPRTPLLAGRTEPARRTTRRVALRVGSRGHRAGKDLDPARPPARRAAHRARNGRVAGAHSS